MARKDKDMPSAPSAAIVDEQTKRAAMRTPTPTSTTDSAAFRKFEETGAGFPDPVVEEVAEWVKAGTVQTADGPVDVNANGFAADGSKPVAKVKSKLVSTYTDEATGDIIDVYEDGTEEVRKKGTVKIDAAAAAEAAAAKRLAEKTSAFDILRRNMKENGLEALADAAIDAIMKEETEAGRLLALRSSDAYKLRFPANAQRIAKGLTALDEASYLAKEDAYQNLMREYGLPDTYYTKDATGKQPGFDQLIANDVSAVELENRLITAQERVIRGAPQISQLLKEFYPEITNGDILAYALDPKNALKDIQRKVTAAEIGAAQTGAGFNLGKTPEEIAQYRANAEQLVANKVTGEQYQAAAPTISEASIRGGQLASIYKEDPYTQQTAEAAVLNTPGSAEAIRKTKKLTALEQAAFSGQSGRGVLARERAGSI